MRRFFCCYHLGNAAEMVINKHSRIFACLLSFLYYG